MTVIGGRRIGSVGHSLRERSRKLATLANVDLSGVSFSSPGRDAALVNATVFPEIDSAEIQDALLDYFRQA